MGDADVRQLKDQLDELASKHDELQERIKKLDGKLTDEVAKQCVEYMKQRDAVLTVAEVIGSDEHLAATFRAQITEEVVERVHERVKERETQRQRLFTLGATGLGVLLAAFGVLVYTTTKSALRNEVEKDVWNLVDANAAYLSLANSVKDMEFLPNWEESKQKHIRQRDTLMKLLRKIQGLDLLRDRLRVVAGLEGVVERFAAARFDHELDEIHVMFKSELEGWLTLPTIKTLAEYYAVRVLGALKPDRTSLDRFHMYAKPQVLR